MAEVVATRAEAASHAAQCHTAADEANETDANEWQQLPCDNGSIDPPNRERYLSILEHYDVVEIACRVVMLKKKYQTGMISKQIHQYMFLMERMMKLFLMMIQKKPYNYWIQKKLNMIFMNLIKVTELVKKTYILF